MPGFADLPYTAVLFSLTAISVVQMGPQGFVEPPGVVEMRCGIDMALFVGLLCYTVRGACQNEE